MRNLQSIKTFDFGTDSVLKELYYVLLKRACHGRQRLQATRKRPVFVLARLTRLRCARLLLKGPAIHLAVKTLNYLLEHPSGVIARWPAGARPWTQT